MSDAKVRVGMIGCGQIAQHHMRTYAQMSENVQLVACCDLDKAAAKKSSAEFKIPNVYTDFRKMLKRDDLDAIDVCLHNNFHAPVSIAAMEAAKHVFCEKPLAGSYADALSMVETSERLGVMLSMQLSSLFAPETVAARRLVEEGRLGKVYYAKSSYYRRRGRCFVDGYGTTSFVRKDIAAGGALFDMGVYHIAQILYLLDNPDVLTMTGAAHQEVPMYEERRAESGFDVEELGVALVRLAGGVTFFVEEAWAVNLGGTDGSKLAGSLGGLSLQPLAYHTTIGDMEMDSEFRLESAQSRWKSCFPDRTFALTSPQHHWVAALQGRTELIPTARIGLNTMLISEGIYLSRELGREVTAEEVRERSTSTAAEL